MSTTLTTIAGMTLFRSREDLDAYFKGLFGEGFEDEIPTDTPAYPFFGRTVCDDGLYGVEFIFIGGTDAFAMAQAIDPSVIHEDYYQRCRRETAEYHEAKSKPVSPPPASDGDLIAWAFRHHLPNEMDLKAVRAAFEDAQTHHLKGQ